MTVEREHRDTTAQPPHWDAQAAGFDDEPAHGPRDPTARTAWSARLAPWLPGHPAEVLDLGCGNGKLLSALIAERQFTEIVGADVGPQVDRDGRRTAALERVAQDRRERVHRPSLDAGVAHDHVAARGPITEREAHVLERRTGEARAEHL